MGVQFVLSPGFARIQKPRWPPLELNDRSLRLHGKIGDCEQSSVGIYVPKKPLISFRYLLIITNGFLSLGTTVDVHTYIHKLYLNTNLRVATKAFDNNQSMHF